MQNKLEVFGKHLVFSNYYFILHKYIYWSHMKNSNVANVLPEYLGCPSKVCFFLNQLRILYNLTIKYYFTIK